MRIWVFGWIAGLLWVTAPAQEPPLINYSAGIGEFEHDELPPPPSTPEGIYNFGDGISDGFTISYSPSNASQFFSCAIDRDVKVSGVASQRIGFNRTGSGTATMTITLLLHFPSEDYPQVGETIRISLWLRTGDWNNAEFRLVARGIDNAAPPTTLITQTTAVPEWTRREATYVVPNSNPKGVRLLLEIVLQNGDSSGTLWLDNLEVYGNKRWRSRPPRSFKIFTYYNPAQPEAQYDWIYYTREFDMIGVFFGSVEQRRMLIHKPELQTTTYYLGFVSEDSLGLEVSIRDPFGYSYCNQYRPEWFLLDLSGQRLRYSSRTYFMDIGNPDCAYHVAQRIYHRMNNSNLPFSTVKFDHLLSFTQMIGCAQYPTPASRIAALTKYFMTLKRELAPFGPPKLINNIAGRAFSRGEIHTYLIRHGYYDGILYEQAFTTIFSLPADYVSFFSWEAAIDVLVAFPNTIRIFYSGYTVNPSLMRPMKLYAMASFLIGCDDNAYIYLDKHYYEGEPLARQRIWRPDADYDVPLGQPTGPYQVYFRSSDYHGGLYYRPFENGFVLVNPTGNTPFRPTGNPPTLWKDGAVFTWVLDDTYYEWVTQRTYPAGTRIKLYPKQARMFIRTSGLSAPPGRGNIKPSEPRK
ncbi:MAG: putative glycoside hydrolase [Armatimonadota bacterium]